MVSVGGNRCVIVRGFDFGTTHEQIASHMSQAGTIERIDPVIHEKYRTVDKGVVRITFASVEEAKWAAQLNQTCIAGNSRYIDVITLDPNEFLAEQPNIDPERAQQFMAMPPEQQQVVMAKGSLSTARDPTAVLVQRMNQAREAGIQDLNQAANGINSAINNGCSVLLRGFDFGTTYDQITTHMSQAGRIEKIDPVLNEKYGTIDKGVVRIRYASPEEAKMALQLEQTIITGNSRYLEVMLLDPKEFLAQHNIESDKAMQFLALTPEQQLNVMEKGSMTSARNPNAVLVTRISQARLMGKGSFGPAQMKGNMGNGPYGGGSGNGGDMNEMMMKQMQMMMQMMMQTMAKSSGVAPQETMAGSSNAPMGAMAGSFGAPMAGSFGAQQETGGAFGASMGMAGSFGAPQETMAGSSTAPMQGSWGAPQSW